MLRPTAWADWVASTAPHVLPTVALRYMLAPLMLAGVVRLLAEWQRRLTLVALLSHAPAGTVIVQGKGLGGPALSVWIGGCPRFPGTPMTLVQSVPCAETAQTLVQDGKCG